MDIDVSEIINRDSADRLRFKEGEVEAIQMSFDYLKKLETMIDKSEVCVIKSALPVFKRHNIKDYILFYSRWYNRKTNADDLLMQYRLEDVDRLPLGKADGETIQRLSFIHGLLSNQRWVIFTEPFYGATKDNIHLFHKLIVQLKEQNKGVIVAVTRTEDAFLVQPDIMRLTHQGLNNVETEESAEEETAGQISKIKVKADDKTLFVDISDIEYLESDEGKVFINISREKFVMESTLQEAEKTLGSHGFYRCHRSYIVNLHKVKEIVTWSKNTYSVVISNPEESKIPLSRTKYNEIQEQLITL